MIFSFTTGLAALLCLAAVPTTHAAEIPVVVGGAGVLAFNPESVTAAVGDTVRFSFRQKNHTVTQSTLASPCVKLAAGFDSGFVPVSPTTTDDFPVAVYTVLSLDPVWAYCAQGTHCSGGGMVFAINPGSDFARFKAAATGAPPSASSTTAATGAPPSATSTTAAAAPTPTNIKVIVGGPGTLAYTPNNIKAKPGDTVTFEFRQKNHTVTQSNFANPCKPLSATALDSGYFPVGEGTTTFPTWTVPINDSSPVWFYCKQGNHCGQGMVLAINSDDSGANSFSAFQAKAKEQGSGNTSATPAPISAAVHVGFGSSLALAMFGVVAALVL